MHSQFEALNRVDPIAARAFSEVLESPDDFPAWGRNPEPPKGYLSLVGINATYLVSPFSERDEPLYATGTFIHPDHVGEREAFLERYREQVGPYQVDISEAAEGTSKVVTETCLTLASQRRRLLGGLAVYADEENPPSYFSQLFISNTMIQAMQFALRDSALVYGQMTAEQRAAIDAEYPPQDRPAGETREDMIHLNATTRYKALFVLTSLMETPDSLSAQLMQL